MISGLVAQILLFLLAAGERSHWHRLDADEVWQWSAGDDLELRIWTEGDEAIAVQERPSARGVPVMPPARLCVRTVWPAFCAIFQPPVPRPVTCTTSPTAGESGSVTTTCDALFAR